MLIRNDLSKLVELVLNGDCETSSSIEQAYPVYFIYQVKSDLGLPAAALKSNGDLARLRPQPDQAN